MAAATPPGRLGDPQMAAGTDPRTHAQLLEVMKNYNLHESSIPQGGPTGDSPLEEVRAAVDQIDNDVGTLYGMFDYNVPALASSIETTRTEEVITTAEGNQVKLIIYRPAASSSSPLPAVFYTHGGGMTILKTDIPTHTGLLESLARTGLVAIAVDFRNAYTKAGLNPFPAGLNDCAAGIQWVDAHREQLGISKIVIHGESGGGNLAIATTLKAKKEGWLKAIDGVCPIYPFISGAYGASTEWRLQNLPSLVECDGYFVSGPMMSLLARIYDPSGENAKNPLAWPYWAEVEDLKGLPPHLIYVNELDPLKDEGLAYFRKLTAANVRVTGKVNLGMVHGGELLLRHAVPDHYLSNIDEIKSFAYRL